MPLLFVAFLAGIFTVISPCVLPLLPVILGKSISDNSQKRPWLIIISLSVSIFAFTLILNTAFKFNPLVSWLPENFWTIIAGSIITLFGVFTLFPKLWDSISLQLNLSSKSNNNLSKAQSKKGLIGDILLGASLGPVFTSCSPTYFVILGLVASGDFLQGIFLLLVYIAGLSSLLYLISWQGSRLTNRLRFAANPEGIFRKILGLLFILVGFAIITGLDKSLETYLLDIGAYDFLGEIENSLTIN